MQSNIAYFWEEKGSLSPDAKCNPYAWLLAGELEKEGFTLNDTAYTLTCSELRELRATSPILHFNWLHQFYSTRNREESLKRMADYMDRLSFARSLGFRIVWTVHNLFPHERPFPELDLMVRLFVAQTADAIIAHCEYAADQVKRLFKPVCDVHVIPHGAYIDAHPNTVSKEEARRKLGVPEDVFVYLNLGNVRSYKGLETLVRVFKEIDQPDARLLLMMKRSYVPEPRPAWRRWLGRLRRDLMGIRPGPAEMVDRMTEDDPRFHVHSSRFFPNEEFQYFLNAADVVVLPFHKILTSGSAILALSFGKPVIVPRLGCLPEMVTEAAGILYDPENPQGLKQAMQDIRGWDLGHAGKAALARANELDWQSIARSTATVYRSVLNA